MKPLLLVIVVGLIGWAGFGRSEPMTPERLSREIIAMGLEAAQIARDLERYQSSEAARARMLDRLLDTYARRWTERWLASR